MQKPPPGKRRIDYESDTCALCLVRPNAATAFMRDEKDFHYREYRTTSLIQKDNFFPGICEMNCHVILRLLPLLAMTLKEYHVLADPADPAASFDVYLIYLLILIICLHFSDLSSGDYMHKKKWLKVKMGMINVIIKTNKNK